MSAWLYPSFTGTDISHITQAFKVVLVETNIKKPKTCLGKSVTQVFLFRRVCTTGNISGYMMCDRLR